jgi:hypothetical protein
MEKSLDIACEYVGVDVIDGQMSILIIVVAAGSVHIEADTADRFGERSKFEISVVKCGGE